MEDLSDIENHKEWLQKVDGTKIPEIAGARPMPGLEGVPLEGLVVAAGEIASWEQIKHPLIPLAPVGNKGDKVAEKAAKELKMLRSHLIDDDAFFVLVKDEQLGGEDQWALSIIKPKELTHSEEDLREGMEACYMAGQIVLAASSRAALLAIVRKNTVS